DIPVTEYAPQKIKMAITGNGNASQMQVATMLQRSLDLKELPKNLDSTDGLAAAVCHFFNTARSVGKKSYSGWGAFVKQNEDRIVYLICLESIFTSRFANKLVTIVIIISLLLSSIKSVW